MKYSAICICFLFPMLITSSIFAADGYFGSGSNPEDFYGKVFDDLYINPGDHAEDIRFDNVTVIGNVIYNDFGSSGHSVSFSRSRLNRVQLPCSDRHHCKFQLDGSTLLNELDLYPSGNNPGMITVNGLTADTVDLPEFYGIGYLCEGQPVFDAAYADAEISIDYQLRDLDTFAGLGKIDTVRIHAVDDASVTFDMCWIIHHEASLLHTMPNKDTEKVIITSVMYSMQYRSMKIWQSIQHQIMYTLENLLMYLMIRLKKNIQRPYFNYEKLLKMQYHTPVIDGILKLSH